MVTKVAVRRECLLDKATLAVSVNDPRKSWVVSERDSRSTIDEIAKFGPPNSIQFVDAYINAATGEPLCESVDGDFA